MISEPGGPGSLEDEDVRSGSVTAYTVTSALRAKRSATFSPSRPGSTPPARRCAGGGRRM
ncbi:hypothetical protein [Streptomyces sp. NPDC023588]|uniref:hypothetical protein n=1 Tax=Streptomyces sp. NPDC023588 TaxID=3154907 RepID=UPI0033D1A2EA